MKTVTEEWHTYRQACFPQGCSATQESELHKAFFAGALIVLGQLHDVAALPEGEAERALGRLQSEVERVMRERVAGVQARN